MVDWSKFTPIEKAAKPKQATAPAPESAAAVDWSQFEPIETPAKTVEAKPVEVQQAGPSMLDKAATIGAAGAQAVLGIGEGVLRTPETIGRLQEGASRLSKKFGVGEYLPDFIGPRRAIVEAISQGGEVMGVDIPGTTDLANKVAAAQSLLNEQAGPFKRSVQKAQNADQAFDALLKGDAKPMLNTVTDPEAIAAFTAQAVPSLYLAWKSGGSLPFLAWLEGMESSNSAADFERQTGEKIDPELFAQGYAQSAGVNALLERAGLESIMGAGGSRLSRFIKGGVGEATTEGAQAFNSNLAEYLSWNPDASLTEGVAPGMIGGGLSGGAMGAARGDRPDEAQGDNAIPADTILPREEEPEQTAQGEGPTVEVGMPRMADQEPANEEGFGVEESAELGTPIDMTQPDWKEALRQSKTPAVEPQAAPQQPAPTLIQPRPVPGRGMATARQPDVIDAEIIEPEAPLSALPPPTTQASRQPVSAPALPPPPITQGIEAPPATQPEPVEASRTDPRLKRPAFREHLQQLSKSLTPGGDVSLVGGDFAAVNEGKSVDRMTPTERTPSINPDWFKSMNEQPDLSMPVKDVWRAVDKALAGKKLGVRQAKVISAMLDQASGERTDARNMEYVRGELEKARTLRGVTSKQQASADIPAEAYDDPDLEYAGEVYDEGAYDPEWGGEARGLYELATEAESYSPERVARILADDSNASDQAADLWEIIRDAQVNETQDIRPASAGEAETGSGLGLQTETEAEPPPQPESQNQVTETPAPTGVSAFEGFELLQEAPSQEQPRQTAAPEQDLFGEVPTQQQAISDAQARVDARLAPDEAAPPVEAEEGLFSGRERQTDIEDVNPIPLEAQKEAGNYKKAHINLHGLDISIENLKGSERTGTDAKGKPWSVEMPADYGYIRRTEGADGDQVDVYMGEGNTSSKAPVFVFDQVDADTKQFDEHKAFIGFDNLIKARETYKAAFSDGRGKERIGGHRKFANMDKFKGWLKNGDTTKPAETAEPEQATPTETLPEAPLTITKFVNQQGEFKSIIVKGDTLTHKDRIKKAIPGRAPLWNRRAQGWIFPKARENEVRSALAELLGAQPVATVAVAEDSESIAKPTTEDSSRAEAELRTETPEAAQPMDKAAAQPEASSPQPVAYGKSNKVFTEDAAAKARALLKQKLGQLSSGIDPEMMQAGITLAGYHIEAGARSFADYGKAMVGDLGEGIRPYLKSFYEAVRNWPGFDNATMTPANEIDSATLQDEVQPEESDDGAGELEGSGGSPLEGAQADVLRGTGSERPATEKTTGSRRPDVQRDGSDDRRGAERGRGVSGREGELSVPAGRGSDYSVSDLDRLGEGGPKAKFNSNVAAIRLVKKLAAEQRPATVEEQATLAKYVGWGGIPQAFDERNSKWSREYAELKEALSDEEYAAARRSTQDAHYTSPDVVRAMWSAVQRLGFKGGRVLEPSIGVGNFIGMMPMDVRGHASVTGVELDAITGRIAKALYPSANINVSGFEKVALRDGSQDLAIGNPPFGSQKVFDASNKDISNFSIHNFFFAKSINSLRDGGVLAMVVSNSLMDKHGGKQREYFAGKARLLGAIRLPNTAFQKNAGTEVTTDIIFLQKLGPGETDQGESWAEVQSIPDQQGGEDIPLNEYYVRHPEMLLGEMNRQGSMYRAGSAALTPRAGDDITTLLADAIARLPEKVMQPAKDQAQAAAELIPAPDDVKMHAFFVTEDGKVARKKPEGGVITDMPASSAERIKGLIKLRGAVRDLMRAELSETATDTGLKVKRTRLNSVYDAFAKKHGSIHAEGNKRAFRDDPDYPLLQSLEKDYDKGISAAVAKSEGVSRRAPSWKKADIFERRVLQPTVNVERADNAQDALLVALSETGRVDLERMSALTGQDRLSLLSALAGAVYLDPEGGPVTADEYLSGNVKHKLTVAKQAAADNDAFKPNVAALEAVQPEDIEAVDIDVRLGSPWIPATDVQDFIHHLVGVRGTVSYQPAVARWITSIEGSHSVKARETWGTERMAANDLIAKILENREIVVRDKTLDGQSIVNQPATTAANAKAEEIKTEFRDWIWREEGRRRRLSRLYNDKHNTSRTRAFDGSHLKLPGMNVNIELRPHQKSFVWRVIQEGRGLADHVVGAGKTFALIAAGMEQRRMGLARKPMYVVPNHLVGQWAADFTKLYPGAKVLATSKKDFEKGNRQKLFARIATGDWDAVIIAHSSFERIGMPPEERDAILAEQYNDIEDAIEQIKASDSDKLTVKEMEKIRDRLKEKYERAAEGKDKDDVVNFGELGVDQLYVDESHQFKKLFFTTTQGRVAGIGDGNGSQRAFDLFVKARYLQKRNRGRGLVFATGTPVSNTMAELYTIQKFQQYDELKASGLVHFDSWAGTFGETVAGWELDATGVNYKLNKRFAKFVNMPELMTLYRSFADVVTQDDLKAQSAALGKRWPIPKIKGDTPQSIVVERSEDQSAYMDQIIHRAQNMPKDPREDNMLKVTGDARKMALDMRLIDPASIDPPESKVNEAVRRITDIYKAWSDRKGAQLVFIDLSTPKKAKKAKQPDKAIDENTEMSMDEMMAGQSKFDVYNDVKTKLIGQGIPADEIAFIHDANTDLQKEALFEKVRQGRVRVLLGSTEKMGAGMNVQLRLVAEHHLDAPWRPSDIEQREGRIIRQGNMFFEQDPDGFEVEINRYATKQTYDARMWQTLEVKARFIEQLRKGDTGMRVIEDIGGESASFADLKAAATGNPLILEQVKLASKVRELDSLATSHKRKMMRMQDQMQWLKGAPARAAERLNVIQSQMDTRDAGTVKDFEITVKGKKHTDKKKGTTAIGLAFVELAKGSNPSTTLGEYRGMAVRASRADKQVTVSLGDGMQTVYTSRDEFSPSGLLSRMDNMLNALEGRRDEIKAGEKNAAKELIDAEAEAKKPFAKQAEYDTAKRQFNDIMGELDKMKDPKYEPRPLEDVLGGKPDNRPIGGPGGKQAGAVNPGEIMDGIADGIKAGQPFERIIRAPFVAMGMLNEHGELDITKRNYDRGVRILTDYEFTSDKAPFQWANTIMRKARAGLIDRHGLSEEFKTRESSSIAEQRELELKALDFLQQLSESGVTSPQEWASIKAMLEGEPIDNADWQALADPIRKTIDDLGQEAVILGLISEETYQRNRGKYLHRVYMKHEAGQSSLGRFVSNMTAGRRKGIVGRELKGRGMDMKLDQERLLRDIPESWWGRRKEKGKGDLTLKGAKFVVLDKMQDPGAGTMTAEGIKEGGTKPKLERRVYWPADLAIPARFSEYTNRGEWEVRDVGGKIKLWRDFTKAERTKMGEILDARYVIAKTFHLLAKDISSARFYKDIANHKDWTFQGDGEPDSWVEPGNMLATYTDAEWVKVPESNIAKTGGVKKWGALAGKYVRAEIWRDISEIDRMMQPSLWRDFMTQWKLNKTARNPVVHMNNIMSNLILMDLIDVRAQDLVRGIYHYKKQSPEYREALEQGAFGHSFVDQEIRDRMLEPVLKEIIKDMERGAYKGVDGKLKLLNKLHYGIYKAGKLIKNADERMMNLYTIEDEIFRMATFMRKREQGYSAVEAAGMAREQFLNYDIRAPWINAARRTVLPFIAYTYRAVPAISSAIAARPWKLAKYGIIAYMVNALGYALAPGDEEEERASLREEEQGMSWIGTPRMIRMPMRDSNGNPLFLDIRRWVPAGDVFDFNQGSIPVLPSWLQLSGPLMIAGEIALNRAAFTGDDIYNELTDSKGEITGKMVGHLYKSLGPAAPWVPGSWYWDKLANSASGARDPLGRLYSLPSAAASSVGIKLKPADVKLGFQYKAWEFEATQRALEYEMNQLQGDRQRDFIDDDEYRDSVEALQGKMNALQENARETFQHAR